MKKLFVLGMVAIIATGNIFAQTTSKPADQLRFYLNPGHGGWGPNDRPAATIPFPALADGRPDSCGFYETNTNLWKVAELHHTLIRMGVKPENITYSRTSNGPHWPWIQEDDDGVCNRPLSEICEEVESGNYDMFVSIHSNAAGDGTMTNYPLFLYRGHDGEDGDLAKGSRAMAKACWPYHWENFIDHLSAYSLTNMNLRGDIDFYGGEYPLTLSNGKVYNGYLGVLHHGTPGFLLEGYFHTYQPARHRALNKDYCYQQGVRLARGICKYFGLKPETKGYIMGTIKDMHAKMKHVLYQYAPGSNDQWVPINGAKIHLLKNGAIVDTYQVDNFYNGVFVFKNLEPGDYTFMLEKDGYKPLEGDNTKPLTVKANETSYVKLLAESTDYVPPTVTYYNYPEPAMTTYAAAPSVLKMGEKTSDNLAIEGTVRRMLTRGDSTVVLSDAAGEPKLYLVDNKDLKIIKQISTTGIAPAETDNLGFYSRLNDIAFTADGQLVGVNSVRNQFSAGQVDEGYKRGTLRFYKWATLDASPVEWFTSQSSANFYRADVGRGLAVNGSADDCAVITSGVTSGSSRGGRFLIINVNDNQVTSTVFSEKTISGSNYGEGRQGATPQLAVSPRTDENYIVDGEAGMPLEFHPTGTSNQDSPVIGQIADDDLGNAAVGFQCFKYAGHQFMVSPFVNASGVGGVRLYDITGGLDKARLVRTETTTLSAPEATGNIAAGAKVNDADITLYLLHGTRLTAFTSNGVEQPVVKNIYAYALNSTKESDGSYTFTFKSNTAAAAAAIVFTNVADGTEVGRIPVNVAEGENTFTFAQDFIPGDAGLTLNWAVTLKGENVSRVALINQLDSYTGAIFSSVDKSPESPFFGQVYVNHRASYANAQNGLYAYDPSYTRINSTVARGGVNPSNNYRIAVGPLGKVWMAEWADANSGVYIADPADLTKPFTQFFLGTRDGEGLFTNDGAKVGSSTPGVAIGGTGADTRLYVANEDMGNDIGVYQIGQPDGSIAYEWGKAPSYTLPVGRYLINSDIAIAPGKDGGAWCSQRRGQGNNTKNVPSLLYVTRDGNVTFNSGEGDFPLLLNGSAGGGFAVSAHQDKLAIGDAKGVVQVFNVTWDANVPTLTPAGSFKCDAANAGGSIFEMNFDYAGNLVCSGAKLGIYAMPTAENLTTTPARKALTVVKTANATGVDNVEATTEVRALFSGSLLTVEAPEAVEKVEVYAADGTRVAESRHSRFTVDAPAGVYLVKVNTFAAVKAVKK